MPRPWETTIPPVLCVQFSTDLTFRVNTLRSNSTDLEIHVEATLTITSLKRYDRWFRGLTIQTRVTSRLKHERNFHIFYQIFSVDDTTKGIPRFYIPLIFLAELALTNPQDFYYLHLSECYTVENMNDATEWKEVWKAFQVLNFTDEEKLSILRLLAGILHLGNIIIGQDVKDQCIFPSGDARKFFC